MKLTITINLDNAAFDPPAPEVARILEHASEQMQDMTFQEGEYKRVYDFNGNKVGEWRISK